MLPKPNPAYKPAVGARDAGKVLKERNFDGAAPALISARGG